MRCSRNLSGMDLQLPGMDVQMLGHYLRSADYSVQSRARLSVVLTIPKGIPLYVVKLP